MKQECARRDDARNNWLSHPPRQSRPFTGHWRKLRAQVLAEEPRCKCGEQSVEVDHIVAKCFGGGDERANLGAICKPCHLTKSAREANVMRWHVYRRQAGAEL
jgi:5-methylcytosine-specific restriction protein A